MSSKAPNQRAITIQKEQSDKKHLYAIINLAAMSEAARKLTSLAGIKLWLYLAKNQDDYKIEAFSAQGFCEWANVSRAAYNTAFEELREKGYLILNEGTKTVFTFYERPQQEERADDKMTNGVKQNNIIKEKARDLTASDAFNPSQNFPEVKEVKEIDYEQAKRMWDDTFTVDENILFDFSADDINMKN